jgi:hypothetical protein
MSRQKQGLLHTRNPKKRLRASGNDHLERVGQFDRLTYAAAEGKARIPIRFETYARVGVDVLV